MLLLSRGGRHGSWTRYHIVPFSLWAALTGSTSSFGLMQHYARIFVIVAGLRSFLLVRATERRCQRQLTTQVGHFSRKRYEEGATGRMDPRSLGLLPPSLIRG
jgi:hypothetical protein